MMKRIIALALVCVCLFSCKSNERPAVFSVFTDGNPMSEDFIWSNIPSEWLEDTLKSDNLIALRSVWDKDSLYFRFDVSDSRLWGDCTENDSKVLWKDDIVEFLLDTRNHHSPGWTTDDIIYHYNILGYTKDDRGMADGTSDCSWNSTGRYIVRAYGTICDNSDEDEGFSVLVAIPWSEIGRKPGKGLVMGFTFGGCDNDGIPVDFKPLFNWSKADPTRSPEQFGVLKLLSH